jgi:hypothetical protein
MKTEFELTKLTEYRYGTANLTIVGSGRNTQVFLKTDIPEVSDYLVKDKDLERFAVNILKALKSKHLK